MYQSGYNLSMFGQDANWQIQQLLREPYIVQRWPNGQVPVDFNAIGNNALRLMELIIRHKNGEVSLQDGQKTVGAIIRGMVCESLYQRGIVIPELQQLGNWYVNIRSEVERSMQAPQQQQFVYGATQQPSMMTGPSSIQGGYGAFMPATETVSQTGNPVMGFGSDISMENNVDRQAHYQDITQPPRDAYSQPGQKVKDSYDIKDKPLPVVQVKTITTPPAVRIELQLEDCDLSADCRHAEGIFMATSEKLSQGPVLTKLTKEVYFPTLSKEASNLGDCLKGFEDVKDSDGVLGIFTNLKKAGCVSVAAVLDNLLARFIEDYFRARMGYSGMQLSSWIKNYRMMENVVMGRVDVDPAIIDEIITTFCSSWTSFVEMEGSCDGKDCSHLLGHQNTHVLFLPWRTFYKPSTGTLKCDEATEDELLDLFSQVVDEIPHCAVRFKVVDELLNQYYVVCGEKVEGGTKMETFTITRI